VSGIAAGAVSTAAVTVFSVLIITALVAVLYKLMMTYGVKRFREIE
jgi:hypothetical protein